MCLEFFKSCLVVSALSHCQSTCKDEQGKITILLPFLLLIFCRISSPSFLLSHPICQGSYIISSSFSGIICATHLWDHNERVDSEKKCVTTRRKFILNTSKVVSSVTQICGSVCMYIVYAHVESLTLLKL